MRMNNGRRATSTRPPARGISVLLIAAAIAGMLFLPGAAPARAADPPPPAQDTPQRGPIVPPPPPPKPLGLPTADIASPQKRAPLPPAPGTATAENAKSVEMKVLVLAGDGSEVELGGIRQTLDFLGTPYQVFLGAPVPPSASTDRLATILSSGTRGNFQAVILTTGTLAYASGGTFLSALTTTEWNTLYNYEAVFKVRQVTWYTFPNADYGFAGTPTSGSAPVSATYTADGQAVFGSYVKTSAPLAISGVFVYFAQPLADGQTKTLLRDGANNALAAVRTYPDGRENLALTFDSNQYMVHNLVLAYGVINWATKGLFIGERRIYQLAQQDDYFIADDDWQTTTPCGTPTPGPTYRMNATDVTRYVAWQNGVRANATTAQIRAEIAYNGVGTEAGYVPGELSPTLVDATVANKAAFNFMSHTYRHADLNSGTEATFADELQRNIDVAATLGLTTYSPTSMVTPGVTGLANNTFLQVAVSKGIRYVISDASKPQYQGSSPNTGVYNALQPSILMVPRYATNLYYNVSTPQGWLAEDNCLYPSGQYGYAATYAALIDRESNQLLQYLLKGDINPLMFHQTNLRAYDGTNSLFSDLMNATYTKYNALLTLPIVNLTNDGIGARMAARMQYKASGASGRIVLSTAGSVSSVTLSVSGAAKVPVTGLTLPCASGCTPELYGGQTINTVTLAAGQSVTLYATPSVTAVEPYQLAQAAGLTATIRGTGFQSGATVLFGANACTNVAIADSATLRCTIPAGNPGAVNVSVTSGGQTATLANGFTYLAGAANPLPGAKDPGPVGGQSGTAVPLPAQRPTVAPPVTTATPLPLPPSR